MRHIPNVMQPTAYQPVVVAPASLWTWQNALVVALAVIGFGLGRLTLNATLYSTLPFGAIVLAFICLLTLSSMLALVHVLEDIKHDSTSEQTRGHHRRRWSFWAALALGLTVGFLPVFLSA